MRIIRYIDDHCWPLMGALFVMFALYIGVSLAWAADAADHSVSLGPFVAALAPFVNALAAALASTLIAVLLAYANKLLGLSIDAKNRDALAAAAQTAAGKVLAGIEGDLATRAFTVDNEMVRRAVLWVQQSAPGAIAHFGLSPTDLAQLVVGKIGMLQAQATPPGKSA